MNNGDGWQKRNTAEIMTALGCDPERGLDRKRINDRIRRWGRNDLWYTGSVFMFLKAESGFSILGYIVMAVAAFSAAAFGKCTDAAFVWIALAVGMVLCFSLYIAAALVCRNHSEKWIPMSTVIRDGKTLRIRGDKLVPGDVVILKKSDTVCADVKLILSEELFVKEPIVTKRKGSIAKAAASPVPAADGQSAPEDHIYAGSEVLSGIGKAVVCAVGEATFIGKKGKIRLTSDKEPVRLTALRKKSVTTGTFAMIFAFAAVAVGIFTPIAAADFIGLFIIFLSFAVSAGGELVPALCCFMYALSLGRSEDNGVLIRDAICADFIMNCEGVSAENSSLMKSGEAKLKAVWASGKAMEPGNSEGDELFSVLIAGTGSGKGKCGSEVLRAVNDHMHGRGDGARFISATETTKPVLEHKISGTVQYSLFVSGGEYYFTVTGSIEEVIGNCTKIRIDERDVPMDRRYLSDILSSASEAAKNASSLIAVAVRKSPYNSMKRLSVLTADLSFVGFIAVDTPADPELKTSLAYLKREKIAFFFFTDGSGEDVNFARRAGIIRDRSELIPADDPTDAVAAVFAQDSDGGAVLASQEEYISEILRTAQKAGKRLLSIGHEECMRGCGFTAVIGDPAAGSCAAVSGNGRGEVPVVLGVLRRLREMADKFSVARKYLAVSATVRAVYVLTVVFGMPYVYPSAVIFWGLVLDAAVSMLIVGSKKKG